LSASPSSFTLSRIILARMGATTPREREILVFMAEGGQTKESRTGS